MWHPGEEKILLEVLVFDVFCIGRQLRSDIIVCPVIYKKCTAASGNSCAQTTASFFVCNECLTELSSIQISIL